MPGHQLFERERLLDHYNNEDKRDDKPTTIVTKKKIDSVDKYLYLISIKINK